MERKWEPREAEAKKALQNRIRRIVGQLQGVERMISQDRYCGDVLVQIAAASRALSALGQEILEEHAQGCVLRQLEEGRQEAMGELMELCKKLR